MNNKQKKYLLDSLKPFLFLVIFGLIVGFFYIMSLLSEENQLKLLLGLILFSLILYFVGVYFEYKKLGDKK